MAYTHEITQNSIDSHQTSPAYVLTFIRYSNRNTLNFEQPNSFSTRDTLVVINDAISIQVSGKKDSPNHSFSCTLKQGDLNYLTAVEPGDYVLVNMVNDEEKALDIKKRALKDKPINGKNDGFKGLFKVGDVRMQLAISSVGIKEYVVSITGKAFDEFSNVLYFNPAFSDEENKIFINNNFKNWRDLLLSKNQSNVQYLVKEVIKRTLGTGLDIVKKAQLGDLSVYRVPKQVPKLLNKQKKGEKSDPYMSTINNYYLGIWDFFSKPTNKNSNIQIEDGFNNFFTQDPQEKEAKNWYSTNSPLSGTRQISLMDFSNIGVWSLLKDYSNPLINESYTCFRIAKDGHVYPSLVVRQKPFNTRSYKKNRNVALHTQFLDMPRWKISPDLIYNINIGRTDAARINFVQIFTRSIAIDERLNQAQQIKNENFVTDEEDIKRNGRKPFVKNCNYDYPITDDGDGQLQGKRWAHLVADWVMNGHLKLNGSLSVAGIEEPICIGDNLELDGVVYHIESIDHIMGIGTNGNKKFITNISISMGIADSNSDTVFGEMDHSDSFAKRKSDKEGLYPGFSDTQDLPGNPNRVNGEEIKDPILPSFTNEKNKK